MNHTEQSRVHSLHFDRYGGMESANSRPLPERMDLPAKSILWVAPMDLAVIWDLAVCIGCRPDATPLHVPLAAIAWISLLRSSPIP